MLALALACSSSSLVVAQNVYIDAAGNYVAILPERDENLIGKWRSEAIREDNASLIIFFEFKDSGDMVVEFNTEYDFPDVGTVQSLVKVTGEYLIENGTFYSDLNDKGVTVDISEMTLKVQSEDDIDRSVFDQINAQIKADLNKRVNYIFNNIDYQNVPYRFLEDDKMTVEIPDEYRPLKLKFQRVF